jgi:hypothetical protein
MAYENLHLGVCDLYVKKTGEDTFTQYHTLGGVTLTIEPQTAELKVDANGVTPVDYVKTGADKVTVKAPLAEIDIDNISLAMPFATATTGYVRYDADSEAGTKISTQAMVVYLKPHGATDNTKNWYFYKALCMSSVSLEYSVENQSVLEVTWECVPDASGYVYTFGNEPTLYA